MVPKLKTGMHKFMASKWTRRAGRAAMFASGAAMVYLGLHDPTHVGHMALGAVGLPVGALGFAPTKHYGKRLKLGILGAHEVKLAVALVALTADPVLWAGAALLGGHGAYKLGLSLFSKNPEH
jgi:hypothetical protein